MLRVQILPVLQVEVQNLLDIFVLGDCLLYYTINATLLSRTDSFTAAWEFYGTSRRPRDLKLRTLIGLGVQPTVKFEKPKSSSNYCRIKSYFNKTFGFLYCKICRYFMNNLIHFRCIFTLDNGSPLQHIEDGQILVDCKRH